MPVRFGEFVFESEGHRLLRGGEEVHLTPKAWELLDLLVRSHPRAVSKTQVRRALWPDTHVGEGSLTVLVSELRSALGDGAREPRYIRTVQGFGYAFATEVVETGPGPSASGFGPAPRVVWGRRVLPLAEGDNVLGRDEAATLRIDDPSVSRRHAVIRVRDGEATLEDLGSKNGTFVLQELVDAPTPLEDGDVLALGEVALLFRNSPLLGETATAKKARD